MSDGTKPMGVNAFSTFFHLMTASSCFKIMALASALFLSMSVNELGPDFLSIGRFFSNARVLTHSASRIRARLSLGLGFGEGRERTIDRFIVRTTLSLSESVTSTVVNLS